MNYKVDTEIELTTSNLSMLNPTPANSNKIYYEKPNAFVLGSKREHNSSVITNNITEPQFCLTQVAIKSLIVFQVICYVGHGLLAGMALYQTILYFAKDLTGFIQYFTYIPIFRSIINFLFFINLVSILDKTNFGFQYKGPSSLLKFNITTSIVYFITFILSMIIQVYEEKLLENHSEIYSEKSQADYLWIELSMASNIAILVGYLCVALTPKYNGLFEELKILSA